MASDYAVVQMLGVHFSTESFDPILLFRDVEGERILPIWIGATEAVAIGLAKAGTRSTRPQTFELVIDVATAAGLRITRVLIASLNEGVFEAFLEMDNGMKVSARPSDAAAIAFAQRCEVAVASTVLDEAAVSTNGSDDDDAQVEQFKKFLDSVSAEDFNSES